jgi:predicted phage tail protein
MIHPIFYGRIISGKRRSCYSWWAINPPKLYIEYAISTPPPAPTNVSATDGTFTDKVQITWTASSGATSYKVYRYTSNNSSSASLIGSPTTTSFNDTSAAAGTTYYYWVKATNTSGDSAFSSYNTGWRATAGSLAEAFDNTSLTVTTGGNTNWFGQITPSYYGGDSAQSGRILDNGITWM